MSARKSLSVKTRFDVFKRDGFVCQYCGDHPPKVLLHVDHIVAVANGGNNDPDNLITACEPCNIGKGARELTTIPEALADKAARVAEAEKQIAGYQAIIEAQRDRIEADAWRVIHALFNELETTRSRFHSVKNFVQRMGASEVINCAEIAAAWGNESKERRFRYFCGVCWNRIKEMGT